MKRLLLLALITISAGELLAQPGGPPGGPPGGGPGGGGPPGGCWPPADCPVPIDNELIFLFIIGLLYASYFYLAKKKTGVA